MKRFSALKGLNNLDEHTRLAIARARQQLHLERHRALRIEREEEEAKRKAQLEREDKVNAAKHGARRTQQ